MPLQTTAGRNHVFRLEDWIVEVRYVLDEHMPDHLQAKTIERYLYGDARLVYKSLLVDHPMPSADDIFAELRTWFGDVEYQAEDPMAAFYERHQRPQESVQSFALALEEILQRMEHSSGRCPDRDYKLVHQLLKGLRDGKLREQLKTMRAHTMSYRQVMAEVRRLLKDQSPAAHTNLHRADTPSHTAHAADNGNNQIKSLERTVKEQSQQIQALQNMFHQMMSTPPPSSPWQQHHHADATQNHPHPHASASSGRGRGGRRGNLNR